MKPKYPCLAALVLVAVIVVIPVAGGSNDTWDPSYYLTHKETLAGPRDMSRYNPVVAPVPVQTMNVTTARLYPNVTVCGKSGCLKTAPCPFPFLRCGRSLTVMVVYNVNVTRPAEPGPVAGVSMIGGPFTEPVYLYRSGIPDIFLQFEPYAGGVR